MKRPSIALIPLYDSKKDSIWMLPDYMDAILRAGGIPVMLPLTGDPAVLDALAGQYDGFLFTGGQDVSPDIYHTKTSPLCGETCPARDTMEQYLLNRLLELDKPVLGICRGLQIINAALGGTLYQDIPSQLPSAVCHRQGKPYDNPIHRVEILPDTPLRQLLGQEYLAVNSLHHQGICKLSPRLQSMAAAEDGLTEAVWMPDACFCWAVQWHPELAFIRDRNSMEILRCFVQAAMKA